MVAAWKLLRVDGKVDGAKFSLNAQRKPVRGSGRLWQKITSQQDIDPGHTVELQWLRSEHADVLIVDSHVLLGVCGRLETFCSGTLSIEAN